MAVQVTCKCGETYSLKDEFAGKLVTCPQCGALGARAVEPMLLQKADEGRGGTTGA